MKALSKEKNSFLHHLTYKNGECELVEDCYKTELMKKCHSIFNSAKNLMLSFPTAFDKVCNEYHYKMFNICELVELIFEETYDEAS